MTWPAAAAASTTIITTTLKEGIASRATHSIYCIVLLLLLVLWQYRWTGGGDHPVVVTTLRKRPTKLYSLEFPYFPSALRCLPSLLASSDGCGGGREALVAKKIVKSVVSLHVSLSGSAAKVILLLYVGKLIRSSVLLIIQPLALHGSAVPRPKLS